MKSLTDTQLKKSSILDFTTDLKIIRSALENEYFEIEDSNLWGDSDRMFSLLAYAEYTQDENLLRRLKTLFKNELSIIFNE